MNWADIFVLLIIFVFGFLGLKNGFIFSLSKLVSFFIAVILAIKFYPVLAGVLAGTFIFTRIKSSIYDRLMIQQEEQMATVNEEASTTAETVIDGLNLPEFLKDLINNHVIENLPDLAGVVDYVTVVDRISGVLAEFVINVISVVLLYIAIRIGLVFARNILEGIAKLPVFKQVNKLGGFAFGAVEGLLTIYIVFAILMLLHTVPLFEGFFDSVEASLIARYFYENNFIVSWIGLG
ncbi:CvpA family protein [Herbivorax sp. ANBcel31]|uniref:CvpA family protein n=1 Tax=Herbivorax sp. ANBcel31 TaxID=3069754 RepID=UPI0027B4970D|nr:CvpA family protein [Herbivorax sp. ANBcel31]MDQ2086697.1 CvpA family protein [Herbivorax sp. ANBcel31]